MGLFRNRNKQEVTEVTLTEPPQQKSWLVWLLSIVTFFLTVAIVLGLFWAGRWVVHQFTKEPAPAPVKTTEPAANNNRDGASTQAISGPNAPSNGSSSNTATGSTNNQSTPVANPSPSITTPTNTPNTGPQAQTLVNTGPDSDE